MKLSENNGERNIYMKTILFVLNSNSYSGAENVVIQIINKLDGSRYSAIYTSPDGNIKERLRESKINFEPVEKLSVTNLNRVIRKYKPDIIHANDYTAVCISSMCCWSIPIIAHLHNNATWIKHINIRTLLFGISAIRCKKILVVSNSIYSEYIFNFLFKGKTQYVGNPVDINTIRSHYAVQSEKIYDILVLGRLSEAKNPILSLRIIANICKSQNIKAVFVGDGELREWLTEKVCNAGLSKNVEIVGFKRNPYEFIAKSKVLLMPSKWEGFGLAAVEGLAYGVPVVASKVGGLKDIITDKCGKLCEKEYEYTNEIIKLLNEEMYYKSKRENAITRSNELNNSVKYFDEIIKVYNQMTRVR